MNNDATAELVQSPEMPSPQTDDKRYRRLGLFVLFMLVGVFGVWSAYAPLESAIAATGKVIVASNNRTVQHLEGGIIKSIHVRDGEQVKQGDVLMELETAQAASQLQIIESSYFYALAMEARLIAERSKSSSISFSSEFNTARGLPYAGFMDNQRREFYARQSSLASDASMLNDRIHQANQQISGLAATVKSKETLLETYKDEVKELEVLYAQQLIDKLRLRDAKRQMYLTQSELDVAKAEVSRIQSQIRETTTQIEGNEKRFQKELLDKLSSTQAQLADSKARMLGLQDLMARTKITSPVDGVVVNLGIHTIGGVIAGGKPIMDIVPSDEPLIVEARIMAADRTNAHVGLKAEVQFPSFAHIKTLKEVEGEVVSIAADAVESEQRELYYLAKIKITPKGTAELYRNKLSLQPGIPASIMIIVAKRTFADYLIHPFKMMFRKSLNEQ